MKVNAAIAVVLIVMLAIVILSGLAVVRLLFGAWRHFDSAQRPSSRHRHMPDIWQAGGDRLLARLEQERRAAQKPPDASEDDQERDEDEDDADEGTPPPPAP